MKSKLFFIICSFFLIFATVDEDNLVLELERLENETITVSWNVNYEDYDTIILEVEHSNSVNSFQLPSKIGRIELCCYSEEVKAVLSVQITKAIDKSDENCSAVECVEYVKEIYQNTSCLLYTSPSPRD